MIGTTYDPGITPSELVARHRFKPMPSREELLSRDSFDNKARLNNNKYLSAFLQKSKSLLSK